jgi:hypothetical protein
LFLLTYPFGPESKGEAATESPNLGNLYVISYVKARLPEVEFYYPESFLSMKEHIEKIVQIKPDVYATSFTTLGRELALQTISSVKGLSLKKFLTLGGYG